MSAHNVLVKEHFAIYFCISILLHTQVYIYQFALPVIVENIESKREKLSVLFWSIFTLQGRLQSILDFSFNSSVISWSSRQLIHSRLTRWKRVKSNHVEMADWIVANVVVVNSSARIRIVAMVTGIQTRPTTWPVRAAFSRLPTLDRQPGTLPDICPSQSTLWPYLFTQTGQHVGRFYLGSRTHSTGFQSGSFQWTGTTLSDPWHHERSRWVWLFPFHSYNHSS